MVTWLFDWVRVCRETWSIIRYVCLFPIGFPYNPMPIECGCVKYVATPHGVIDIRFKRKVVLGNLDKLYDVVS